MDQTDALARLNKERDYEDRLVNTLTSHFLNSLDGISGLTASQKKDAEDTLRQIAVESGTHSFLFNKLIQMVLENGPDEY